MKRQGTGHRRSLVRVFNRVASRSGSNGRVYKARAVRATKAYRTLRIPIIFQPFELMERLAALVPAPRFNMIRYSGVLAPSAAWRQRIIPKNMEAPGVLPASSEKYGQNTSVLGEAGSFAIAAQEGKAEKLNDSNPRSYDIGARSTSHVCSEKCGQNTHVPGEAGSLTFAAQERKTIPNNENIFP